MIKETACVYDGLRNWMNKYGFKISNLLLIMGYDAPCRQTMYRYLRGDESMTKNVIDAILTATGMTYEQAFMRADANETLD